MNPRFNNLKRKSRYTFVFGNGVDAITGVFHDITSDGCLHIAGSAVTARDQTAREYRINPDNVIYAREER